MLIIEELQTPNQHSPLEELKKIKDISSAVVSDDYQKYKEYKTSVGKDKLSPIDKTILSSGAFAASENPKYKQLQDLADDIFAIGIKEGFYSKDTRFAVDTKPPHVYIMSKGMLPSAFVYGDGSVFISQSLINLMPHFEALIAVLIHEVGHLLDGSSAAISNRDGGLGKGLAWLHEIASDVITVPILERLKLKSTAQKDALRALESFVASLKSDVDPLLKSIAAMLDPHLNIAQRSLGVEMQTTMVNSPTAHFSAAPVPAEMIAPIIPTNEEYVTHQLDAENFEAVTEALPKLSVDDLISLLKEINERISGTDNAPLKTIYARLMMQIKLLLQSRFTENYGVDEDLTEETVIAAMLIIEQQTHIDNTTLLQIDSVAQLCKVLEEMKFNFRVIGDFLLEEVNLDLRRPVDLQDSVARVMQDIDSNLTALDIFTHPEGEAALMGLGRKLADLRFLDKYFASIRRSFIRLVVRYMIYSYSKFDGTEVKRLFEFMRDDFDYTRSELDEMRLIATINNSNYLLFSDRKKIVQQLENTFPEVKEVKEENKSEEQINELIQSLTDAPVSQRLTILLGSFVLKKDMDLSSRDQMDQRRKVVRILLPALDKIDFAVSPANYSVTQRLDDKMSGYVEDKETAEALIKYQIKTLLYACFSAEQDSPVTSYKEEIDADWRQVQPYTRHLSKKALYQLNQAVIIGDQLRFNIGEYRVEIFDNGEPPRNIEKSFSFYRPRRPNWETYVHLEPIKAIWGMQDDTFDNVQSIKELLEVLQKALPRIAGMIDEQDSAEVYAARVDYSTPRKAINLFSSQLIMLGWGQDVRRAINRLLDNGALQMEQATDLELIELLDTLIPNTDSRKRQLLFELNKKYLQSPLPTDREEELYMRSRHLILNKNLLLPEGMFWVAELVQTYDEYLVIRKPLQQEIRNYLDGKQSKELDAAMAVDKITQHFLKDPQVLIASTEQSVDSAVTANTKLAQYWLDILVIGPERHPRLANINDQTGRISVKEDMRPLFISYADLVQELKRMNLGKRRLLAYQIMTAENGILSKKESREELADALLESIEIEDPEMEYMIRFALANFDVLGEYREPLVLYFAELLARVMFSNLDSKHVDVTDQSLNGRFKRPEINFPSNLSYEEEQELRKPVWHARYKLLKEIFQKSSQELLEVNHGFANSMSAKEPENQKYIQALNASNDDYTRLIEALEARVFAAEEKKEIKQVKGAEAIIAAAEAGGPVPARTTQVSAMLFKIEDINLLKRLRNSLDSLDSVNRLALLESFHADISYFAADVEFVNLLKSVKIAYKIGEGSMGSAWVVELNGALFILKRGQASIEKRILDAVNIGDILAGEIEKSISNLPTEQEVIAQTESLTARLQEVVRTITAVVSPPQSYETGPLQWYETPEDRKITAADIMDLPATGFDTKYDVAIDKYIKEFDQILSQFELLYADREEYAALLKEYQEITQQLKYFQRYPVLDKKRLQNLAQSLRRTTNMAGEWCLGNIHDKNQPEDDKNFEDQVVNPFLEKHSEERIVLPATRFHHQATHTELIEKLPDSFETVNRLYTKEEVTTEQKREMVKKYAVFVWSQFYASPVIPEDGSEPYLLMHSDPTQGNHMYNSSTKAMAVIDRVMFIRLPISQLPIFQAMLENRLTDFVKLLVGHLVDRYNAENPEQSKSASQRKFYQEKVLHSLWWDKLKSFFSRTEDDYLLAMNNLMATIQEQLDFPVELKFWQELLVRNIQGVRVSMQENGITQKEIESLL